jgi:hypothetical protein
LLWVAAAEAEVIKREVAVQVLLFITQISQSHQVPIL